ncbi:hypothetical protein KAW64_17220 [bacterium]|nr:hypothetical protein [bacterium]
MIRERPDAHPSFGSSLALSGWSRTILWFTRFRKEPRSWATHILNVRRDGETAIESTGGSTKERQWREVYDTGKHWGVLVEIVGFTPLMRDKLEVASNEYLDEPYGKLALLRHGLDGLLGKVAGRDVFWFRKMAAGHPLRYNICSWFTTHTHRKAGWLFEGPDGKPLSPGRASPDDVLDDVFERRLECYRIAAEFGPRPKKLPISYIQKIERDLT